MTSRRHDLESEFQRLTQTDVLGRTIEWFERLPSTNAHARTLAQNKTTEGTIVIADEQTEGRGRLDRSWYSPPAGGLWVSFVLYPTQSMAEVPHLTVLAAEAVKSFLKKEFDIVATIKEPNDLLIAKKKVCGILAEASTQAGSEFVDYVVIGIGLNLSVSFPPELADQATSVAAHCSETISPRTQLLARLAKVFEERYLI